VQRAAGALLFQQQRDPKDNDTKKGDQKFPWILPSSMIDGGACGNFYTAYRGSVDHNNNDDDVSIIEDNRVPTVSPTTVPKRDGLFDFMDEFLSPIMSCMEPRMQMCSETPTCAWDGPTSAALLSQRQRRPLSSEVFDEREPSGTVSCQRPDFLKPVPPVRRHKPTLNDVVCGKGHNQSYHPGNQNLRDLITANQAAYSVMTKKEKQNLSRHIVGLILLHTDPPGRFLGWEATTGYFVDVGLARSIEKTNQGFRDALLLYKDQNNDETSSFSSTLRKKNGHKQPKQLVIPTKKYLVHIPDHLVHVYSKIPKPLDFLQYPELMEAMKLSVVPPPPPRTTRRLAVPYGIPGPFPVTKPPGMPAPPALVSPRQYYVPETTTNMTTGSLPRGGPEGYVPAAPQKLAFHHYHRLRPAVVVAPPILPPPPPQQPPLHDLREYRIPQPAAAVYDTPFDDGACDEVVRPHIPLRTVHEEESPPRRIHDWKRRRTVTGDDQHHQHQHGLDYSFESNNNSLTEAMESTLTLTERVVRSPVPPLQHGAHEMWFPTAATTTRNRSDLDMSVDSADGQAALAATAYLKLDDVSDSD
jgi:hypothetical protein